MAQDRKALLAVILAVKRGFVSPEEGMNLLEQAEKEPDGAATIYEQVPHSQAEELRQDATVLAEDTVEAEKLLVEAGVAPEVQKTLLSLSSEIDQKELEATLLSLAPTRATTIIERPKLKTSTDERYKILREHARGGMGRILVAEDKVVGREVALKELLPFKGASGTSPITGPLQATPASATATAAAARFLREATVTGQLEHPNIVPVYEIGQREDGSLYYTMKFVKGRTLASRLRAIRNDVDLTPAQKQAERMKLLDGFVDICNAIAFAHSRGVIHRDIKPANIMLGDFGEAMVLDWGLARVIGGENVAVSKESNHEVSPELTLEGEVMGTPAYMPPEQAAGKLDHVDERSDVYSLGAVLFEIVSGEAPYVGKTAKQVLSSVLSEDPRRVDDINGETPPELAALVMRCLERRPEDRFQSARELADEVQAFRDGRMVSTYRYSAVELLKRFVAKNRGAVAVSALALILMIAGGVYAYTKVKGERDAALAAETDARNQRTIAENQAIEAEHQKQIAEDQASEAERQKGIAKEQAEEAERQKTTAEQKAKEAEFERKRADDKAAEAAQKAEEARQSEERATRALEQAKRNLAQAHMGYATLAEERGQPGGQVLHLAAAHAADPSTVSSDQLVSALSETAFPVWRSRSYVDLPAGAATFSQDRRLCAAPMYKPPKLIDDIRANANATALPDIGIWDVGSATLLRRISTETTINRRMAFSGDGNRLAVLEASGTLRLWDITTGNEIASRALYPWGDTPLIVPAPNGEAFFTAGNDGKVWEWSFTDGSAVRSREMKDATYTALAVSPDGLQLAAGTEGSVLVWNLESEEPPRELPMLEDRVNALCFSPEGLVVGLAGAEIQLWDVATATKVRAFESWAWAIGSLEVSPDAQYLVVGMFDQGWKLFNYKTSALVLERTSQNARLQGITFSPDGQSLLVALKGEGFDVLALDGTPLMERAFDHLLGSLAVEISPDGRTFASGDQAGRLLLRRVADGTTVWSREASKNSLLRVTFSPDGTLLAVYAGDGTITFFDTSNGNQLRFIKQPAYAYCVKFSPDGRFLIAPTSDGPIQLIDTKSATVRRSLKLGNGSAVIALGFDPLIDRVWLIDRSLTVWDWRFDTEDAPAKVGQLTVQGTRTVYTTTISPDGKIGVIALDDGNILGWQTEPFAQLYYSRMGEGPITNCAFGPGSGFFACGTADGLLCFANARTGKVVKHQRAHRAAITGTAVSPDGRDVITSGVDGEFLAWDAPSLMYPSYWKFGTSTPQDIRIAPGGKLAASVSDSGMIRLFDSETGDTEAEFDVLPWYVQSLAFSTDGAMLAACHTGGRVLVWDVATHALLHELQVHDSPTCVVFDATGRLIVNGQCYGLQIYDSKSGELLLRHRSTEGYYDVMPFPDGKRALQISQSGEPRSIDLESGKVLASFERSAYFSHANAISPDGTVVALMRDRGLIGIHDSETGERLRTLKVRPNYICGMEFFADGRRLFYVTEGGGAAVVDINSGQELAGTWFGYPYVNRGALSPDGGFALIAASTGEIERWSMGPVLLRNRALAMLDVQTVIAMAQLLSGMILDNLETIALPRRTGRFSWKTPDGKAPEFLRGVLPNWVPRLQGTEVARARDFLRGGNSQRATRLDAAALEWTNMFEGYRYKEVLEPDLSTTRVAIPAREKDAEGNYIGEPEGRVDLAAWLRAHRREAADAFNVRVRALMNRGAAAMQRGEWRTAQTCYNNAFQLQPTNMDALREYCRACAELRDTWNATWLLSQNFDRATPVQRAELQMIWARLVGMEGDYEGMLQRFQAARDAGYKFDDWYLRRVSALEESGRYDEAIAEADLAAAQLADKRLRAEVAGVRNRCIVWKELRKQSKGRQRIVIAAVPDGSNAASAGLKPGDMILSITMGEEERLNYDPEPVDDSSLRWTWQQFADTADDSLTHATMKISRAGTEITVEVPRGPLDAKLFTIRPVD
ncbi:MAG: protein kinase [Planctomycetes bacterium]|nr:protein kinase [Planctomycetota bacterium]